MSFSSRLCLNLVKSSRLANIVCYRNVKHVLNVSSSQQSSLRILGCPSSCQWQRSYCSYPPVNASLEGDNEGVRYEEEDYQEQDEPASASSQNHLEPPSADAMERVKQFWKDHDIRVYGKDAAMPVFDFHECRWPDKLMTMMESEGFERPTPIQSQGWPIALSGRDIVGIAQTGSGKTLCYVLPALVKILNKGITRGPQCLVLAPTRELAQQIQSVVRKYRTVNDVCLYGGSDRKRQIHSVRAENPQIVVATPGRLNDLIESQVMDLSNINYLVLDEADRMLDMGFEPQIRKIIDVLPQERQTLMWSATWPEEVRALASQFMSDYIQINVGGTKLVANKNIKQHVFVVEEFERFNKLMEVINQYPQTKRGENKALIFTKTKQTADLLARRLSSNGKRASAIHGDKSQAQRNYVMGEFRDGRILILCATDVAARGLDVNDIKMVINYDFPNTIEDYIHRIGRTARAENTGVSYTFFTEEDKGNARDLVEVLRDSNQEVNEDLLSMSMQSGKKGKRVWGYERKPQRDGFGGGYRNNARRENKYDRNNRNYIDYGRENSYDVNSFSRDFRDERTRMKSRMYNDNYSVRRPINRDEYDM